MKVCNKKTGSLGYSDRFNIHAMSEIIVGFKDGDMDSDFIRNYDVYIEAKKEWVDLHKAFQDKDIIIDNYNTKFFEPTNEEDKLRGFTL